MYGYLRKSLKVFLQVSWRSFTPWLFCIIISYTAYAPLRTPALAVLLVPIVPLSCSTFEAPDPEAVMRQFHLSGICFVSDDYGAGMAAAFHLHFVSDDLLSQSRRSGCDHSCISFNLDCLHICALADRGDKMEVTLKDIHHDCMWVDGWMRL